MSVYSMLLGELIEHSRTEDLFLNPTHGKTADYMRADMDDLAHPSASSFLSRGCSTLGQKPLNSDVEVLQRYGGKD